MRKLCSIILFILACSIFAFPQDETPKEADWRTFAPETEEFSIDAPVALNGSLTQSAVSKPTPEQLQTSMSKSRRYLNTLNGTYFYIFSDDWKTPDQYKFVLRFAYDSNQLETTQKSGELTTTLFEFSDAMNFQHRILAVSGKDRVYVFQTVSPTKENPLVERFFSSLKINQKSLLENSPNAKVKKETSVTITESSDLTSEPAASETVVVVKTAPNKPDVKPEVKAPTDEPEIKVKKQSERSGIGNGNGDGGGNQTAPETPTAPAVPEKTTVGVKILSKPRANYTDYARFYEIQGKVLLRVIFSANGSIGGVTPISKLPFGITEQAIAAARGLRFEPALKEGVPRSVTKPVEYTFTIY